MKRWRIGFALVVCAGLGVSCDNGWHQPISPSFSSMEVDPARGRRGTVCEIGFWDRADGTYSRSVDICSATESGGPFISLKTIRCRRSGDASSLGPAWTFNEYYYCTWEADWPRMDSVLPIIRIYPRAIDGEDTVYGEPISFEPLEP